jgi:hypothetical protein
LRFDAPRKRVAMAHRIACCLPYSELQQAADHRGWKRANCCALPQFAVSYRPFNFRGEPSMRALFVAGAAIFAMVAPAFAAVLGPSEIQATFFTGQPFTASASSAK